MLTSRVTGLQGSQMGHSFHKSMYLRTHTRRIKVLYGDKGKKCTLGRIAGAVRKSFFEQ